MRNSVRIALGAVFAALSPPLLAEERLAPGEIVEAAVPESRWRLADAYAEDPKAVAWVKAFTASLRPRTGRVELDEADATLEVPSEYYFLDAKDAQRVLEEAWGNPPDDAVLGMIFPAGAGPLDEGVWAATVTYVADGYVGDKDAQDIDYAALMADLQKSARDENSWRRKSGYQPVEILGWAEAPTYDAANNKMHWARELRFGDAAENTLNYDIRVLGRRGVLVIGFVSGMSDLAEIKRVAPDVLAMAEFSEGSRYADFVPGADKVAAYGLAGLVAGAAIAKKTGLIAAIAIFAKKFAALAVVGLGALGLRLRKVFGKKGPAPQR